MARSSSSRKSKDSALQKELDSITSLADVEARLLPLLRDDFDAALVVFYLLGRGPLEILHLGGTAHLGEDLVRSLVLVDQAPLQNREDPLGGAWQLGSTGCYDSETLRALGAALQYAPAGGSRVPRAFADGNAEACFSQTTPWMEAHPEVLELLASETLRCSPAALLALMADHTRLDWRPLLPRVRVPAWNCVGVKSKIFPWEGVAWVGDAMPRGRNVLFEQGGHWLYLEEPERFAEVVLEAASHLDAPARPAAG